MKLDTFTIGLAGGLTAAIFNLIIGLIAMWWGWAKGLAGTVLNTTGDIGWGVVLLGAVWGFVIFFILGSLFAGIYNSVSHRVEVTKHAKHA